MSELMSCLHPICEFLVGLDQSSIIAAPAYYYQGHCPRTGTLLRLPRTALAEAIARGLMRNLTAEEFSREGKMYGVLLVEDQFNRCYVLKAFSGLLNGKTSLPGWVPPIAGRDQIALEEARTLVDLNQIKQELLTLQQIPERQTYTAAIQEFETKVQQLSLIHQQRKQERQAKRQYLLDVLSGDDLDTALEHLNEQSRRDGIERRRLKQQRNAILQPLQQIIAQADARIRYLKQRRKALSQHLQQQMHAAYRLTNFAGESLALQELKLSGLPTGTGECCAPKLLHYAATHQLKPLALAEFWWGDSSSDKTAGEFYEACAERCQPLMGFLLSGLPPSISNPIPFQPLDILYQDDWLIAVNKPAGLLSVPGRYVDRQDSVLSRLQKSNGALGAVHRLDQDTSGVLLLAQDVQTYRQLNQQFQQRRVHKVYEAILAGTVAIDAGEIDLPLWGDPTERPRQQVNWQQGKPSQTRFRVVSRGENQTRIELIPITGRTHQLRVHAADVRGLGIPIWGDRLYGCQLPATRLHLHARELQFCHPYSGQIIHLHSETPF